MRIDWGLRIADFRERNPIRNPSAIKNSDIRNQSAIRIPR